MVIDNIYWIPSSSFHDCPHCNGQLASDLLHEWNLMATNTRFQKKCSKLWTIEYANGSKGQIDYVLINKKWKNSVIYSVTYSSFDTLNSDHCIVTASVRFSLRANKPMKASNGYDWSNLVHNHSVRDRYLIEVRNRFDAHKVALDSDSTL